MGSQIVSLSQRVDVETVGLWYLLNHSVVCLPVLENMRMTPSVGNDFLSTENTLVSYFRSRSLAFRAPHQVLYREKARVFRLQRRLWSCGWRALGLSLGDFDT